MEGIISSDPIGGTIRHGLTASGRAQARAAATQLIEAIGREELDSLLFVSSNFTRARETAADCRAAIMRIAGFEREVGPIVGGAYECPPVLIMNELRERNFGTLDGTTLINYNK
eukprot:14505-Heterococcus_DN1.PRE.2